MNFVEFIIGFVDFKPAYTYSVLLLIVPCTKAFFRNINKVLSKN